jgi:predicted Zn finger-like uncharacterized protein
MAEHITQCPNCQTAFRVTEDNLKAAGGAVRCGSCQEVFDANSNLASLENQEDQLAVSTADQNEHETDDGENETISETYISELLVEESDAPASAAWDQSYNIDSTMDQIPTYEDADPEELEDSIGFSEEFLELANQPAAIEPSDTNNSQDNDTESAPEEFPGSEQAGEPIQMEQEPADTMDSALTDEEIPVMTKEELLAGIETVPVEMQWQKSSRPSLHSLGSYLGIVAAAVLLLIQYTSANFDQLARESGYRVWLGTACNVLGCQLPDQYDIHQIRSSNLVVRSHPDYRNALVIDAIITNRAGFKQPFPDLQLHFTDMNGQLVAHRAFKALEYLDGELTGSTKMPAGQPIHVSLEILDPGPQAINYSLSIHPANS